LKKLSMGVDGLKVSYNSQLAILGDTEVLCSVKKY